MTILDPKQQAKILTAPVLRLMTALRTTGEARIVGGAVRDILMNRTVGDIDLATNIPPERVIEILSAHKIKTVPTGLAHGTLTAVIEGVGYEITTLRRDVATDGRHATVAFTDDWQIDAARRDFTFNALYLDAAGQIYDYFNGQADAAAGSVRFIGDAQSRIREDVLRILRFFRFYAWFGHTEPDPDALSACRALAHLIPTLSAERIARETLKLLSAENPVPAWRLMIENNITAHFLKEAADLSRLAKQLANEQHLVSERHPRVAAASAQAKGGDPSSSDSKHIKPLTRLAALLPQDEPAALATATKLKLSNRDSETLTALAKLPALINAANTPQKLRHLLYIHGIENCRAAAFLAADSASQTPLRPPSGGEGNSHLVSKNDRLGGEAGSLSTALSIIAAWENPRFPLKGQDIVKSGIPAGPRVGDILRATEEWWISGDFRADREACLDYAKQGKNL